MNTNPKNKRAEKMDKALRELDHLWLNEFSREFSVGFNLLKDLLVEAKTGIALCNWKWKRNPPAHRGLFLQTVQWASKTGDQNLLIEILVSEFREAFISQRDKRNSLRLLKAAFYLFKKSHGLSVLSFADEDCLMIA